ncbi:hypothetical protein pipiens_005521 [Culex pipiens pipiens]|uniref:Secreted protein n=1 Tax=Culex pipiens pipiens TaxID=38569 RepID=A0ABD1DXM7_CULPP
MLPVAQLKMLVYVSLVLIVLSTARFCRAEADGSQDGGMMGESTRHKRGPTVGLFAFPRVGRSDPADLVEWSDLLEQQQQQQQQLAADDYEDYPYRTGLEMAKRQGKLVAFPRVVACRNVPAVTPVPQTRPCGSDRDWVNVPTWQTPRSKVNNCKHRYRSLHTTLGP